MDNTYLNYSIPPHMGTFPITNQNQHHVTNFHSSNTFGAPLYSKPAIIIPTTQDPMVAKHQDAIMNLTKQIS